MSGQNGEKKTAKYVCVGLLAHVDAGKTTLSEAILYTTGTTRKLGRVDNRDAYLDTYALERERGITIFSKQAVLPLSGVEVTLLDTPGHVDFSSEMERTLQVLDCAILVISGTDGVQGHTHTLWRLLERYGVPTFLFVNKMDLAGADKAALLAGLKAGLDEGCVDFTAPAAERDEAAALCGEDALERYLEDGALDGDTLTALIARRRLFPCWFGSALKLEGVDALLDGLDAALGAVVLLFQVALLVLLFRDLSLGDPGPLRRRVFLFLILAVGSFVVTVPWGLFDPVSGTGNYRISAYSGLASALLILLIDLGVLAWRRWRARRSPV